MNSKTCRVLMVFIFILCLGLSSFKVVVVHAQPVRVFRLLAVEQYFDSVSMKSGQYLINALRGYPNWNNGTCSGEQYVSYIHLLTECEYLDSNMTKFYKGVVTRDNIINEITSFLCKGGDVLVFYYIGHGWSNCTNYYMSIRRGNQIIWDYELNQLLPYSTLKDNEWMNCTVVIIDSCNSEDALRNIGRLGRDVMVACKKDQSAWGWVSENCSWNNWGWFTGQKSTTYQNGTSLPLGVIGGLLPANDADGDGWVTTREVFALARPSTTQYAIGYGKTQNPESHWGLLAPGVPLVALCTNPFPGQYVSVPPPAVGGIWVPINKFELLAPYVGLSGIISTLFVTAAVAYAKRRKKQQT